MKSLKTLSFCQTAALSVLLAAALPSCDSTLEPLQNTCKGVDCSGHGECKTQGGQAVCVCEDGYVSVGLSCQDPCSQVNCSYKEKCEVQDGKAVCVCGDGYVAFGTGCIEDPCIGMTCSGHGYCDYQNGEAFCVCDEGFEVFGLLCVVLCSEDSQCNDDNVCTDDLCNPRGGCLYRYNTDCTGTGGDCREDYTCDPAGSLGNCDIPGAPTNEGMRCNDGNACTGDGLCSSGVCTGGQPLAEGTSCDDGLMCNGTDTCDANGSCIHSGHPCGNLVCNEVNDTCETPTVEWIQIPGGTYMMGSDDGESDEQPVHEVTISDFMMAKTEVTVEQYGHCVTAGACSEPPLDIGCNWGEDGRDDHPIGCLTYEQAVEFCTWVRGRLPTEAEWEYASRGGGQDIIYPWGNDPPSCEYAVMFEDGDGCGTQSNWPVCSKAAGNTSQGLCDMAGSEWEWVQDYYHDDYTCAPTDGSAWMDDECSTWPTGLLQRGGSWTTDGIHLRTSNREQLRAPKCSLGWGPPFYGGVRCAR
jgi:formylglycine-generating enzyme required for sulfatase activity